ncbi:MAG: hypothetical protein IJC73_01645 [Lentisphaeria bacterium]|nr:hypothetical protein [Lentisphaeria bacterium]
MEMDNNLNPVLEKATNEDLQYLVDVITNARTNSLEKEGLYKQHCPDHKKYVNLIADELRAFGGNTLANMFRGGKGPEYKEIVCDVADKLKAPFNKDSDIEKIENSILETVLTQAFEKMSESEKQELLKEVGDGKNYSITGPALTTVLIAIFRAGGIKSYLLVLHIVNAITKIVLGRSLGLIGAITTINIAKLATGPFALALSTAWTLYDIAGPATRVTVPAVIYVAMLRKKYNMPFCPHCNQMIAAGSKFCPECGKTIEN